MDGGKPPERKSVFRKKKKKKERKKEKEGNSSYKWKKSTEMICRRQIRRSSP